MVKRQYWKTWCYFNGWSFPALIPHHTLHRRTQSLQGCVALGGHDWVSHLRKPELTNNQIIIHGSEMIIWLPWSIPWTHCRWRWYSSSCPATPCPTLWQLEVRYKEKYYSNEIWTLFTYETLKPKTTLASGKKDTPLAFIPLDRNKVKQLNDI